MYINSLGPGKFEWNFKYVIFKLILVIDGWRISCDIALIWMPLDFTDDQSALVQVMAWCCQATSHYLIQCWPSPMSPCGVTRPKWVKDSSACWGLNELTALFQIIFWKKMCYFLEGKFWNFIFKKSLKFIPEGPVDNKLALAQVMAWHQTGKYRLPELKWTCCPLEWLGLIEFKNI